MMARSAAVLIASLLLAACQNPPPRPWLRYEAQDAKGWQAEGDGRLSATLLGAQFVVDLHKRDARIELVVENRSGGDIRVQIGPEATMAPSASIGDLQRRPLDQSRGEDVSTDFLPYVSMQAAEIRNGWRGTFYLDSPLGRDPTIGQYLVLVLEVRDGKKGFERRFLPLVATNAGTLR